MFVTP